MQVVNTTYWRAKLMKDYEKMKIIDNQLYAWGRTGQYICNIILDYLFEVGERKQLRNLYMSEAERTYCRQRLLSYGEDDVFYCTN